MGRKSVPTEPPGFGFLGRLRQPGSSPLVIAHRGDSLRAPENTLLAAEIAWQVGADAWELDVHLSRDGTPVVLHDESLTRTTDVADRFAGDSRADDGYLVSRFAIHEIQALDAGRWFLRPEGGHRSARSFGSLSRVGTSTREQIEAGLVRVPTLREALEFTRSRQWYVNVEIKSESLEAVSAVIDELDRLGMHEQVLVSSFHHGLLARLRSLDDRVATGVLTETPIPSPVSYVRAVPADCYHLSLQALKAVCDEAGDSGLSPLTGAGIPVLVYTVNRKRGDSSLSWFARTGVAGVFTDDPESLISRGQGG